jgi:uncharacterized protein YbaP (TraB family)
MNKHILKLILLLVISSLMLFSCKTGKEAVTTIQTQEIEYENWPNKLLWEISGNNLETPSYLFGTVHLIENEYFFLPEDLEAAMDRSAEVVFEIDVEEMTDISAQMSILTKAFMKDNLTIKDLLSEDDYAELSDFFSEMGLPLFFFERLKPMFLTILTSMDGGLDELQSQTKSYEFELMDMAKSKKIDIDGLETIDYQIGLFDSIPYKEQADMLMQSIRSQSDGSEEFDAMMKMYVDQDIESMVSSIGEDATLGKYERLLLNQRNENWIPIMSSKMAQQTTFFAVGAGHLAGKDGVLFLLKKQGYNLKPLN